MIYTADTCYLGSMPKTATTAATAGLMRLWDGGYRYNAKDDQGEIVTGHAKAWTLPRAMRARRHVFGTICDPHTWYRRVYLHATDSRSPAMIESLQCYGRDRMDPVSVFYGMTHPGGVKLPRQALLIQPVVQTCALAHLQTGGGGLWSFAVRYYFGAECPRPGAPVVWGVNALVDSADLDTGLMKQVGEPVELEIENSRGLDLKRWLDDQYDHDEMDRWIEAADGATLDGVRSAFGVL